MEIYIRATGKMEKPTATESLLILMEACMKVNGSMINNMVMEQNHGILRKLNTLETSLMVRRLGMDGLNLREDIMKVNSKMENLMVEEFITSLILVKFMMVNSRRTIWMVKD